MEEPKICSPKFMDVQCKVKKCAKSQNKKTSKIFLQSLPLITKNVQKCRVPQWGVSISADMQPRGQTHWDTLHIDIWIVCQKSISSFLPPLHHPSPASAARASAACRSTSAAPAPPSRPSNARHARRPPPRGSWNTLQEYALFYLKNMTFEKTSRIWNMTVLFYVLCTMCKFCQCTVRAMKALSYSFGNYVANGGHLLSCLFTKRGIYKKNILKNWTTIPSP